MPGFVEITPWHWAGFIACVLIFLALDLGVFHRRARVVKFGEAAAWSAVWFALAMAFAGAMAHWRGREEAVQFTTGYLIELSLSLDNILVIALIFAWFRVPVQFQHRLLFWGILGALVMRGAMIAAGAELISQFDWVLYVFGAFLVFTGVKMLFSGKDTVQPEKNLALRLARKLFRRFAGSGRPEILHPAGRPLRAHAAGAGAAAGRDDRFDFCRGFRPGGFFRHAQGLHRLHLERLCHPRPALDVFFAGGRARLFSLFENRPVGRAGLHRRENAARPARPANRNGFRSKSRPAFR